MAWGKGGSGAGAVVVVVVAGCGLVVMDGVAGDTVIVPEVPLTELVVVSVAVTVWAPAVAKVTPLKVRVPLSPAVNV